MFRLLHEAVNLVQTDLCELLDGKPYLMPRHETQTQAQKDFTTVVLSRIFKPSITLVQIEIKYIIILFQIMFTIFTFFRIVIQISIKNSISFLTYVCFKLEVEFETFSFNWQHVDVVQVCALSSTSGAHCTMSHVNVLFLKTKSSSTPELFRVELFRAELFRADIHPLI